MKYPQTILVAALSTFAAYAAFTPLTREDAAQGRELCITGVVTSVAYWQRNSCIVASTDDPNGQAIYVSGEHPDSGSVPMEGDPIAVGDVLQIRGKTIPMFFAPGVYATEFKRLSRMELPPAPLRTLADFSQGLLDNRRTRLAGVVSRVSAIAPMQTGLTLATSLGTVDTRIHAPLDEAMPLLDAEVVAEGVAMSRFNHRAEYLGVRLEVESMRSIFVTKPSGGDPFSVREVPLNAILAWSPEGNDGHRRLVKGTVTAAGDDGIFYLQAGNCAVRATALGGKVPPVGRAVEAAGSPEMIGGVGQLMDVAWRESADAPEEISPIELTKANITNLAFGADITYEDFDCRLVSLEGRIYRIERKEGAFDLFLDAGGVSVGATVRGGVPDWLGGEQDFLPLVRVTGIARIATNDEANGRRPGLSSISIELQSPSAIEFVPDAEWRRRKRQRFSRTAANVAVPILLACGAVALWRTRVRKGREAILAAERRRMADDLHDTIQQHMAGARILLSTAAANLPPDAEASAKALSLAQDVLAEAKTQIRDVILNLRQEEVFAKPLAELLSGFAAELNARAIVKARSRLRGIGDDISASAKVDVMAIARQAVANAINHGRAANVAIVCDPAPGGWVLRILNDGAEFDVNDAPGPDAGHFGLANMRERAKRSGFAISWTRDGAWMSVNLEYGGPK